MAIETWHGAVEISHSEQGGEDHVAAGGISGVVNIMSESIGIPGYLLRADAAPLAAPTAK